MTPKEKAKANIAAFLKSLEVYDTDYDCCGDIPYTPMWSLRVGERTQTDEVHEQKIVALQDKYGPLRYTRAAVDSSRKCAIVCDATGERVPSLRLFISLMRMSYATVTRCIEHQKPICGKVWRKMEAA